MVEEGSEGSEGESKKTHQSMQPNTQPDHLV